MTMLQKLATLQAKILLRNISSVDAEMLVELKAALGYFNARSKKWYVARKGVRKDAEIVAKEVDADQLDLV